MNTYIVFLTLFCATYAQYKKPLPLSARYKRDAVGNLEIITNNAHPIHAEVKPESLVPIGDISTTDKVTPPKDTSIYPSTSLRKSWPLTSRLDLVRSVARVVTLLVLVFSAAFEFYPLLQHLYDLYYF